VRAFTGVRRKASNSASVIYHSVIRLGVLYTVMIRV